MNYRTKYQNISSIYLKKQHKCTFQAKNFTNVTLLVHLCEFKGNWLHESIKKAALFLRKASFVHSCGLGLYFVSNTVTFRHFLSDLSVQKYPNTFEATIYQTQRLNNVKALAGKSFCFRAVHAEHVLQDRKVECFLKLELTELEQHIFRTLCQVQDAAKKVQQSNMSV